MLDLGRDLVVKSVLEGQIGSEHLTDAELTRFRELTFTMAMIEHSQRSDVTVFINDQEEIH